VPVCVQLRLVSEIVFRKKLNMEQMLRKIIANVGRIYVYLILVAILYITHSHTHAGLAGIQ